MTVSDSGRRVGMTFAAPRRRSDCGNAAAVEVEAVGAPRSRDANTLPPPSPTETVRD